MNPNDTEEVCAAKPIWPDAAAVQHGPNARGGRDFVAGDIHGHFATLEHALDVLTFDPARDRLFGVGDLVDRDPRAENAIAWLEEERLKPVRGNHDQLMIGALAYDGGELLRSGPSQWWDASGGNWWYRNRAGAAARWGGRERLAAECDRWLSAWRKVPFMRTIEAGSGRIGIVHTLGSTWTKPGSGPGNNWKTLETMLDARASEARRTPARIHSPSLGEPVDEILWGRPEIERENRDANDLAAPMQGIDLVIIGHTPGLWPRWTRRNVLCIDTGVFVPEYGHLTIAEIQTGTPRTHRFRAETCQR